MTRLMPSPAQYLPIALKWIPATPILDVLLDIWGCIAMSIFEVETGRRGEKISGANW